jgi:peptidoglycan/LPS O-acetylase OafA/YrhL
VLLAHLSGTRHFFRWEMFEIYGDFGVRVFFVISGYLITSLLLKEHEKTGRISLTDFYVRRAYRILPAAYVYMLVVIATHWNRLSSASIVAAVTYTSNYLRNESWVLGHLWSLSVEEQFYLLWPLTLAVFFRKKLWVVAGLLLSGPPLRVLFWMIWGYHGLAHFFPVLMDALGAGCALAMLHPQLQRWDRWVRSRWFLLVPAVTALLPLLRFVSNRSYQVAGLTLMHIGIALSIQHAVQIQYRMLNWRPVAWMGMLSYSFYLWQQPFLNRSSQDWWTAFPQNLLLVGLFGAASYYCVEKPFLALRERRKEKARADQPVPERKPVRRQEVPGSVTRVA